MPNFQVLQLIGEIALGIVGFSAILIGLSRSSAGFKPPDMFRIQMLTFSGFGAMFAALLPFALFNELGNVEISWIWTSGLLSLYALTGLIIFPLRMIALHYEYPSLFPLKLVVFQTGIIFLVLIFSVSIMLFLKYVYSSLLLPRILFHKYYTDTEKVFHFQAYV